MEIRRECLGTIPNYFHQVYHVYNPFYDVTTESTIFWDATPFSLVEIHRRLWERTVAIFKRREEAGTLFCFGRYTVLLRS